MKRKCNFTLFLILLGVVVFSQPSKVPVKTVTTGVKPMKMTRVALGPLSYEYKSDNGHVNDDYVTQHRMKKNTKANADRGFYDSGV